jgi:uncharacterized protein (TIGR03000 family)
MPEQICLTTIRPEWTNCIAYVRKKESNMRQLLSFAALSALGVLVCVGSADAGLLKGGCGGHKGHGCGGGCASSGCASGGCGAVVGGGVSGHCYMGGCSGGVSVAVLDGPRTATLVVDLPADARLLIDGQTTRSETAHRVFETPALETGRDFSYTLQAQVVRDGKTEIITKNVTVRAGEATEVRLELPATAVAAR